MPFMKDKLLMDFKEMYKSQISEFVKKISNLMGPLAEIKDSLEELEFCISNSNWSRV